MRTITIVNNNAIGIVALCNHPTVKYIKPNTHHRRRRNSTVELSRLGGVNAPVGSRDPVYNFLYLLRY